MLHAQIKAEASGSPDLRRLQPFHFKFLSSHDQSRTPSDPPTPLYHFGSYPNSSLPLSDPASPSSHHSMSYSDEYDDLPLHPYLDHLPQPAADRAVRRRSSKGPFCLSVLL